MQIGKYSKANEYLRKAYELLLISCDEDCIEGIKEQMYTIDMFEDV